MTAPFPGNVLVQVPGVELVGDLTVPPAPSGIVVFAHGSGSGRTSPRNRYVAGSLASAGFATLLFDLLTPEEEAAERHTRHLRFDIPLLAGRLIGAIEWLGKVARVGQLPVGLFGASTGAAAALIAAAELTDLVGAVVSRGGRPDLAGDRLADVRAPVLLLVGGMDREVLQRNRAAQARLGVANELHVVAGASHLFEEPGTLDEVTHEAVTWFLTHLVGEERLPAEEGHGLWQC
jgi:putative phosphoribosyl transferase